MIDDKKIEEKANELCDYGSIYDSEKRIDGFITGAHWAIQEFFKDLWHPAEEEPTTYKKFVYLKSNQEIGVTSLLPSFDWGNMVHNIGITYWFYLDDILSKQKGGEQ